MQIGEIEQVVAAIIPCLDEEAAIGELVHALIAQGVDRVIVVDGGSRDSTVARATEAGAQVLVERQRGYGRACAAGIIAAGGADVLLFMDGDGSDDPAMIASVLEPVMRDQADFSMGSRLRGTREPGSLGPQQYVAGVLAGVLLRVFYGARFTDMSPFRAIRPAVLQGLHMQETTYGWNLEMQMRAAACGLRLREVPVGCRVRRGGVSKVSGNVGAVLPATWSIMTTFARLAASLRRA